MILCARHVLQRAGRNVDDIEHNIYKNVRVWYDNESNITEIKDVESGSEKKKKSMSARDKDIASGNDLCDTKTHGIVHAA